MAYEIPEALLNMDGEENSKDMKDMNREITHEADAGPLITHIYMVRTYEGVSKSS